MLDWSKIFNIVSVAVAGALIVFFLASVIAVAVKGKRRCNAFDVILRILATLVFVLSAAMLFCSVLTMLDGGMFIGVAETGDKLTAVFVMNGKATELPVPELFALLASNVGAELVVGLFICSLAALIVDCLVANKKPDGKAKRSKAAAVKAQPKSAEQLKREAELEKIRKIGESAVQKTASAAGDRKASVEAVEQTEKTADAVDDGSADFDWRTEQTEKSQTEFVGIKTENDEFDTFDSFDDADGANANVEAEEDDISGEVGDEDILQADDESSEPIDEGESVDDGLYSDADNDEDDAERQASEASDGGDYADEEYDAAEARYSDDEYNSWLDGETRNDAENMPEDEHIEPNRDIYIPKLRTITRSKEARTAQTSVVKKTVKQKTAVADRQGIRSKPKTSKPTGAVRNSTAVKKSIAAKPESSGKKRAVSSVPDEKKLPVTRRYVILDRRNAVNMFGEYLKDRNKTEKDKLQSSINTIIIE